MCCSCAVRDFAALEGPTNCSDRDGKGRCGLILISDGYVVISNLYFSFLVILSNRQENINVIKIIASKLIS